MGQHLGLMFRISMNGGRKTSELERQVLMDATATDKMGYDVPASLHKQVLTYTPKDDIVKRIQALTTEPELEAAYQGAILSAESAFAEMRTTPPLQGINVRVHCFQYEKQGIIFYQTVIAKTLSNGRVVAHLPGKMVFAGQVKDIDLLHTNHYKDWKGLADFLKDTAHDAYFVGHLEAVPVEDDIQVRLRLESANATYSPQGQVLYSSGENGFLDCFDGDAMETELLDKQGIPDPQRLPALAALWAAVEYTDDHLEVGAKGVLDCMSPTTKNKARYNLKVVHAGGPDFNVDIRMGNAITGNSFGKLREGYVNVEQRSVRFKDDKA